MAPPRHRTTAPAAAGSADDSRSEASSGPGHAHAHAHTSNREKPKSTTTRKTQAQAHALPGFRPDRTSALAPGTGQGTVNVNVTSAPAPAPAPQEVSVRLSMFLSADCRKVLRYVAQGEKKKLINRSRGPKCPWRFSTPTATHITSPLPVRTPRRIRAFCSRRGSVSYRRLRLLHSGPARPRPRDRTRTRDTDGAAKPQGER